MTKLDRQLSEEWADSLTPADVLGWYDFDQEHDAADDVLSAFEEGYSRGVQDEAVPAALPRFSPRQPVPAATSDGAYCGGERLACHRGAPTESSRGGATA